MISTRSNTPSQANKPSANPASPAFIPVAPKLAFGERYRPREVGTGYGASSGYASGRRYADSRATSYFRCS